MKVGILGDIHANLEALNTCLDTLVNKEKCDFVMATGDIVGYGPRPAETLHVFSKLVPDILRPSPVIPTKSIVVRPRLIPMSTEDDRIKLLGRIRLRKQGKF